MKRFLSLIIVVGICSCACLYAFASDSTKPYIKFTVSDAETFETADNTYTITTSNNSVVSQSDDIININNIESASTECEDVPISDDLCDIEYIDDSDKHQADSQQYVENDNNKTQSTIDSQNVGNKFFKIIKQNGVLKFQISMQDYIGSPYTVEFLNNSTGEYEQFVSLFAGKFNATPQLSALNFVNPGLYTNGQIHILDKNEYIMIDDFCINVNEQSNINMNINASVNTIGSDLYHINITGINASDLNYIIQLQLNSGRMISAWTGVNGIGGFGEDLSTGMYRILRITDEALIDNTLSYTLNYLTDWEYFN